MVKTILVCSDGSEHALKAAQRAAFIAKQSGACALLLNVAHAEQEAIPYVMPWQMEYGETPSALVPEAEQEDILNKTAKLFAEANVRCQLLRECGHPAAQIVRVAEREDVDLIVMGSRGLSVLKSLLLGSVSDHVIHHAHCSVLVVR